MDHNIQVYLLLRKSADLGRSLVESICQHFSLSMP